MSGNILHREEIVEEYRRLVVESSYADVENGPSPDDELTTYKELWKTASSTVRNRLHVSEAEIDYMIERAVLGGRM